VTEVTPAAAFKFLLELCALAALAYWGATTGGTLLNVVLGIGAPLVAAVVWGRWAAPTSPRRLAGTHRLALESAVFAAATLALVLAGAPLLALAFALVVVLDTAVLWRERAY
jgi:quinol-cytochrome oxidoreductase complex cytochrome b subunit